MDQRGRSGSLNCQTWAKGGVGETHDHREATLYPHQRALPDRLLGRGKMGHKVTRPNSLSVKCESFYEFAASEGGRPGRALDGK